MKSDKLRRIPKFDSVAIVSDKPRLVAEISSLFGRPGRYLATMDGPRMMRTDASNEIIRRKNSLIHVRPRRIILAGLPTRSCTEMAKGWSAGLIASVDSTDDAANALRGWVKRPQSKLNWGSSNLGVGLLLARRSRKELATSDDSAPSITFVPGGKHLLIACEAGHELADIASANLAYSSNASFLSFPEQSKSDRKAWHEELYGLQDGDISVRFVAICKRARQLLGEFPFQEYAQILFVTGGFPWGIAVPSCPSSHMFNYPDFGRCLIDALWAANDCARSARNAILIDPEKVDGSELDAIAKLLTENRPLVRYQSGPHATVNTVKNLVETLPFDLFVVATHAGDVPGKRNTYEYVDSEGIERQLVVDEALTFVYDPRVDNFSVSQFQRFHQIDGIDWHDTTAKSKHYLGTAIQSWLALGDVLERRSSLKRSEDISRVIGSMGLQMHDQIWIPMMQGLASEATPLVFSNACSSWHELGFRFMYAGARAYIGTLFPVTGAEAQEVGRLFFKKNLEGHAAESLWAAQESVYGTHERRPYAMLGLPWSPLLPNSVDSFQYMIERYKAGIAEFSDKRSTSPHSDVRENSEHYIAFLEEDFRQFLKYFQAKISSLRTKQRES